MTICDLVADLRAPTPSAAAEVAVRAVSELSAEVRALGVRLRRSVLSRVDVGGLRLHRAGAALDALARRGVERRRARVQTLAGRLEALSPLATLQRGYAVARDAAGHVLGSVGQFSVDDEFRLTLRDGEVRARTTGIKESA